MIYNIWISIYYTIYQFHVFIRDIVCGIFFLLFYIPAIKKLNEHRGITKETVKKEVNISLSQINRRLSDASISVLTIMIETIIVNFVSSFAHNLILSNIIEFYILAGLAFAFNYFTLWKNDKYRKYFTKINNKNKNRRRGTLFSGCISILVIFLLFILSFICFFINT